MQAIVAHKVLLKFERSICGLNINVGTWFRQFFQCVTDADHFSGIHKNLSWEAECCGANDRQPRGRASNGRLMVNVVTGEESNENKCDGIHLDAAATGTGKTHSAKAIARQLHSVLLSSSPDKSNAAAAGKRSLPNIHQSIKRTPIN